MKARVALAAFLAMVPAFADATQVVQPSEAAVRGAYGEWEIAIREPQTTSLVFEAHVRGSPSLEALVQELRDIYYDREVVVDRNAHTLRVSDSERRLPLLLSEYRRRFGHEPPTIPETPLPDDLAPAMQSDLILAMRPVGNVRSTTLVNGQPSLVCDVRGAVVLTGWGPDAHHPLRGARTVPVDGVDVELADVETGQVFRGKTDKDGHYTIPWIPMPKWREGRRFRESVLSDGAPVPVPNPIAVCSVRS
jgi:hypothetical protein